MGLDNIITKEKWNSIMNESKKKTKKGKKKNTGFEHLSFDEWGEDQDYFANDKKIEEDKPDWMDQKKDNEWDDIPF